MSQDGNDFIARNEAEARNIASDVFALLEKEAVIQTTDGRLLKLSREPDGLPYLMEDDTPRPYLLQTPVPTWYRKLLPD